jgi:hypothetical protein
MPDQFEVFVEQFDHVVHVFMAASFAQGDVDAKLEGVFYDGGQNYQVNLNFTRAHASGTSSNRLIWTSLGNPGAGSYTLYIRHATLGTTLQTVEFSRILTPPLAQDTSATLDLKQAIGEHIVTPVAGELAPHYRAMVPKSFNHLLEGPFDPDQVVIPFPLFFVLALTAGSSPLTDVSVSMTSTIPQFQITPVTPTTATSVAASQTFSVKYKLEAMNLPVGTFQVAYDVFYKVDGVQKFFGGSFPVAAFDPGLKRVGDQRVEFAATIPWVFDAGELLIDGVFAGTNRNVRFAGDGTGTASCVWKSHKLELSGFPTGPTTTTIPVGATVTAEGNPAVLGASVGCALIAGAACAVTGATSKEGKVNPTHVAIAMASAALTADLAGAGAFVRLGQWLIKQGQAILEFAKKVALTALDLLIDLFISIFSVFVESVELGRVKLTYVALDGSQADIEVLGSGDLVPMTPLGSNVQTVPSIPF